MKRKNNFDILKIVPKTLVVLAFMVTIPLSAANASSTVDSGPMKIEQGVQANETKVDLGAERGAAKARIASLEHINSAQKRYYSNQLDKAEHITQVIEIRNTAIYQDRAKGIVSKAPNLTADQKAHYQTSLDSAKTIQQMAEILEEALTVHNS